MNKIHGSKERISRPESINFKTKVLASRNTAEADTFAYTFTAKSIISIKLETWINL